MSGDLLPAPYPYLGIHTHIWAYIPGAGFPSQNAAEDGGLSDCR
ncbi:MAG: hypothetical protein Q8L87_20205 [Anaerolineales bacterium]|nr:hypothetical protein [Anaerolineales bacterium]